MIHPINHDTLLCPYIRYFKRVGIDNLTLYLLGIKTFLELHRYR